MNKATLSEISQVLGHKTLSMVKRYSHLSEEHTSGVVERMNKSIFAQAEKESEKI
jgi:site-specific recombinase XerD